MEGRGSLTARLADLREHPARYFDHPSTLSLWSYLLGYQAVSEPMRRIVGAAAEQFRLALPVGAPSGRLGPARALYLQAELPVRGYLELVEQLEGAAAASPTDGASAAASVVDGERVFRGVVEAIRAGQVAPWIGEDTVEALCCFLDGVTAALEDSPHGVDSAVGRMPDFEDWLALRHGLRAPWHRVARVLAGGGAAGLAWFLSEYDEFEAEDPGVAGLFD